MEEEEYKEMDMSTWIRSESSSLNQTESILPVPHNSLQLGVEESKEELPRLGTEQDEA
jgi:hypothetical protein